jgi:hypothetical protein
VIYESDLLHDLVCDDCFKAAMRGEREGPIQPLARKEDTMKCLHCLREWLITPGVRKDV